MRIILIGAASRSFGLGQIIDVLRCPDLRGRSVTLALVDGDAAALDLMTRVAQRARSHLQTDVQLESHTDRRAALPGADYVITAVARRRYELWEQDYRVPLAYGFHHVLGENGGPGALFHALRSFELIIPICRDVERLCPDALVMNFTNPEARVLHAISHLTRVKAAGFCHGVFGAMARICKYLGKDEEELDIVSAGMNHFYCILKVWEKSTGVDLLPQAVQMAAEDASAPPVFRTFAQVYDVFTFPSDDHIGEYLTFGAEFHGALWPYGRERRKVRLQEAPEPDYLTEYATGKRPADDPKITAGSHELTVPIICDIELKRDSYRPAVNVLNREGYIENLPRHSAVEVPARVDAEGIHPLHVGALPESFAAFIRPQCTIHDLLTEAYRTGSRKLLLQALLLDPNVNSVRNAERMLDEMLNLQSEFLPRFQ